MTLRSQNFSLSKTTIFLHIFSFMIDVFTPKRDLLIVPETHKNPILTLHNAVCSVYHTAELDSAVGCTPRGLIPLCAAHRKVFWETLITWLRGVSHTAELESTEGCTTQSQTSWNLLVFLCFRICNVFWLSFFLVWSKKDSLDNSWLTVLFSY